MADRDGCSYGSIESTVKKEKTPRTTSSQPFNKPVMGLHKLMKTRDRLMSKVLKLLGTEKVKDDFTYDESKSIIRELSGELNRVVKISKKAFLDEANCYESCQEDRQEFILQWAGQLKQSSQTVQVLAAEITSKDPLDQNVPDREQKLKEARKVLSDWAWKLKDLEQDSVCPGEDVCSVLQDLERQWKRGKLPSMLPVMDFLVWTMLQEQSDKGSIVMQWFRNKQGLSRFKKRVALTEIPDFVEITLDKDTANACLELSTDRKRVKMAKIIESVSNPLDQCEMTSKMYNAWWCVLGTEGFDSGKHYWEVGVKGKSEWRIGVVRESAPRHGFTNLNTQTGYWTLRLQLGELMAVTTPVTKLTQCVPSKVGVYLDLEEGQVSFYDAEKRLHIYTFDVDLNQSEKIFPLFHTTETDRELIIL
uniref:B30.2/SPRY domain-containing protein n=1 Tax=Esox lucius TaxID=8010 RepID=A0A3P9A224_ESOLU